MVHFFFFKRKSTAFVAGCGLLTLVALFVLQNSPETIHSTSLPVTSIFTNISKRMTSDVRQSTHLPTTIHKTVPESTSPEALHSTNLPVTSNKRNISKKLSNFRKSPELVKSTSTSAAYSKRLIEQASVSRKILASNGMRLSTSKGPSKTILLVTTWRSGSAFTGELLSTLPGVMYNYEPFMYLGFRDIPVNNQTRAKKYVYDLSQMLQCNYGPLLKGYQFSKILKGPLLDNNGGYKLCRETQTKEYCSDPARISHACQYFPIQVSKLTRMPLRYIVPLLRQPELNLHVILLVRDPRGTSASRRNLWWCMDHCADRKRLCDLLLDNYNAALQASKEFPEQFTVLRYEDLAIDPAGVAHRLTKHFGIPLTDYTLNYIKSHTSADKSGTITVRRRGSRVVAWKKDLQWEDIQETQTLCKDVLNKYGYLPVASPNLLNETETIIADWKLPTTPN